MNQPFGLSRLCGRLGLALYTVWRAAGQEPPPIQDNSFLIEEAYNQERGVVQHISSFSRMRNSKDWNYSFTQEWPAPWSWRHQLSYTLVGTHAGAFSETGAGWGDAALNYSYQMIGSGHTRFAFSPRLSVLLPLGDAGAGRGAGSAGLQTNLPLSIVLHRRLVTHWNAGSTYIPHAQDCERHRAASVGFSLGQSVIFLVHPRINLLLETWAGNFQSVVGDGRTEWSRVRYMSPGVRWALNFRNGLQIVPGVAVPMGIAGSSGERGVLLYLSFEHPFARGER